MSFWDSLFGKSQKKDIQRADREAADRIAKAEADAAAQLERGRGDITSGSDRALTDIDAGAAAARDKVATGYDAAAGEARTGLGNALAQMQPYLDSGRKSQKLFDDLQGLNGPDAQAAAVAVYEANPYLAQEQERVAQQTDRYFRARGMSDSGRAALASARAVGELGYKDYQGWKGDLEEGGARGGQYATQAAQFTTNTGEMLAKLRAQRAESESGIETGAGTARASINQNRGNALAGVSNNLSQLRFGAGTTQAGRIISTGNALAANRLTGFNNLLKVASIGAQAAQSMGQRRSASGGGP